MTNLVTAAQIYPALKALLGLPELCTKFELRVSRDDIVTVACEHYVSLDAAGIADLARVFGEYELVRRADPAADASAFKFHAEDSIEFQSARAKVIGFDAWMRERTDAAHAAYMAGHASGGIAYN